MAWSIHSWWIRTYASHLFEEEPFRSRPLCLHVCGRFHCDQNLGIPEHLAQYWANYQQYGLLNQGGTETATENGRQLFQRDRAIDRTRDTDQLRVATLVV